MVSIPPQKNTHTHRHTQLRLEFSSHYDMLEGRSNLGTRVGPSSLSSVALKEGGERPENTHAPLPFWVRPLAAWHCASRKLSPDVASQPWAFATAT